jgi:peptidoglycan-associated lipoprotein
MKRSIFSKILLLALATSLVTAGCKSKPPTVQVIPETGPPVIHQENPNPGPIAPPNTGTERPVRPVNPGPGVEGANALPTIPPNWMDRATDTNIFQADTVYFDYDRSTVKSSEKSKLEAVASFFKDPAHAQDDLIVQGHCDERGTEQYNLALGERRALAIREALIALGVSGEKIHPVSYGLSRPAVVGHNEAAWSKNRRGEFVLVLPAPAQ